MNVRAITLSDDEAQTLEEIGTELLRSGDARGVTLLALHLQWRSKLPHAEPDTFSRRVDAERGWLTVLPGGAG